MTTTIPYTPYTVPTLGHRKDAPYVDFPLVYNETVTTRPFYVDRDWTFITSDSANTTLYKWNGYGYTAVTGWTNPDHFTGRGFYAVTTAAACYVAITEHVN